MAETKAPTACMLCGKIVHKAYLREHYRNIHNDIAALLSSPTPTGFALQKLEGFSTRLWAVREEGVPKGLGYCTACHHTETSKSSDPDKIKAEIGAGHVCKPPIPRPNRRKEVQAAKVAAVGGAGVSSAAATTKGFFVPYEWLTDLTEQDLEGYGLDELLEDIEGAKKVWPLQQALAAANKELEALKAATPVSAGSTSEAFTRTLTELFDARGIGKWVREKHVALKKDYEAGKGYDAEYPFTARDTLLGIVGIAKEADLRVSAAEEEMIQVRREMNLMRLQMEEAQRKTLALSATVNEQAAKIHELEAPLRAQAAAAYAAQRAEIAQYLPDPTQQPPAESPA